MVSFAAEGAVFRYIMYPVVGAVCLLGGFFVGRQYPASRYIYVKGDVMYNEHTGRECRSHADPKDLIFGKDNDSLPLCGEE